MTQFRKSLLLTAALVGFAMLGAPTQAHAAYFVVLSTGGPLGNVNDNNLPAGTIADANAAVNAIAFNNISFQGYTINFSGSTNTPGVGGLAFQTSNTITVTAIAGASPLFISVFADGYNLGGGSPSALMVTNSISTTAITNAATGSAQTHVNGGGPGLSTTVVSVTGPTVLNLSDSSPTLFTPPTTIPFSLTSVLTIGGLTVGNTANITWTSTAQNASTGVIPAPGAVVLLASGIPFLCGAACRRMRKKSVGADSQ